MSMLVLDEWAAAQTRRSPRLPVPPIRKAVDGLRRPRARYANVERTWAAHLPSWRRWVGPALFASSVLFVLTAIVPRFVGTTVVVGESMEPTMYAGDFVLTRRQAVYSVGDVVVYRIPAGQPGEGTEVIHRIVGGDERAGFLTLGDNRTGEDPWRPTAADIVGTPWRVIPKGGLVILWFRSPMFVAMLVGVAAFTPTLRLLESPALAPPAHARPRGAPRHARC